MQNGSSESTTSKMALGKEVSIIIKFGSLIVVAIAPVFLILMLFGLQYLIISNLEQWLQLLNLGILNYIVLAVLMLIVAAILLLILVTPALVGFSVNLLWPVLTSWLKAILSSAVFMFVYLMCMAGFLLLVNKNLERELSYKTIPYLNSQFIWVGLLVGVGMSGSLGLAGLLGARIRKKKSA